METLKGVCIGAGYFSHFHCEAWTRIPTVHIAAICDNNVGKAREMASKYEIPNTYSDYLEMFEKEKPDFVDIITPPDTHFAICKAAADLGIHIICQKPLTPTLAESKALVACVSKANIRFMVHENFRFQPWHREIKKLIDSGILGEDIFSLNFRMRMGDGWQKDAYLARQPYFRAMPKLLIYETGIHFIDTFRYLSGEIRRVYAILRKINKNIAGEDCVLVNFEFENRAVGVLDGSRYHESNYRNPRYTFGEFLVEGSQGCVRLYSNGRLTIQPLGQKEKDHPYQHRDINFAGDCVFATQTHFSQQFIAGEPFETGGRDYLKSLAVQEAIYKSNEIHAPVLVSR
ncbi:Gfo/Idh/MocA family oxidoreductase [Fulvivirgaceae bacterium BMA12]|uniref:Gfo/Idh/MocA family oxidoreductase n=1 Tax=Agaribacillus aureus TaxID=3051825 RepID=A0ABT8L7P9_9BACT|nr:Gfo/Idh/MocA family oxidoreductase [Fulvivirgaceae bacterium BMA12]